MRESARIGRDEGIGTECNPTEGADDPDEAPVAVDVSLIDEMLRLTPAERVRQNDRVASLAVKLREAFAVGDAACPNHEI